LVIEFVFPGGLRDFSFGCPVYEVRIEVMELVTSSYRQLLEFILCSYQVVEVVIDLNLGAIYLWAFPVIQPNTKAIHKLGVS
jgi:hypothetical protein